jgi:RimJ/RimL family protein N-acetyltransferase
LEGLLLFISETERLTLKPHTLHNVEKIHAWENDPALLFYNDDQPEDRQPDSLAETHKYVERIMQPDPERNIIYYAIHKKETDSLIGYGMIAFIDSYNRRCRLGITIGEKEEWGKGYAREALVAVINYCFQTLDLNRVGVEIYAFNERSIHLFEHLGFQREGVIRQAVWKNGAFADEYIYGLLKSEWQCYTSSSFTKRP